MKTYVKLTLNDYMINEVIGKTSNRAARVEELMMKGYVKEQEDKKEKRILELTRELEFYKNNDDEKSSGKRI